jgi:transposase-like protein
VGQVTFAPHCVPCSEGVRRSAAEKQEIIHLVEHSALPVGRTLDELDVPCGSFCRWNRQYQRDGEKGLEPQPSKRRQSCLSRYCMLEMEQPTE